LQNVHEITSAIASASTDAFVHVDAFRTLYDAKFDMLYAMLRRRTGVDESTALDLVQETMVRVIRHMKPLRSEAELDAWLGRVAMTTAYDHLRKERRRRLRELKASVESRVAMNHAIDLDETVESLRREIESLDRGVFDLLSMRYRAGMTLEAIGKRLGIGPGAVDGRLRRAINELRRQLKEQSDVVK